MQDKGKYGRMLTVKDGWLECPSCRRNGRLMQVRSDTEGHNIVAFCRVCKTEHVVDIVKGECFES